MGRGRVVEIIEALQRRAARPPDEVANARTKRGAAFEWLRERMEIGDDDEIAYALGEFTSAHLAYMNLKDGTDLARPTPEG